MDDKKALLDRFKQVPKFLRKKGVAATQVEMAKAIGCTPAYLSDALHDRDRKLSLPFLEKVADTFPSVLSKEWLLTGKGEIEKVDLGQFRLHIPADKAIVSAGFVGAAIASVSKDECELMPIIPYLPRYDYTIHVRGESMSPTLLNGDTIACEWQNGDIDFKDSKIYVIDTDGGAVVKRVKRKGDTLICHSDNPDYADFSVSLTENMRIARVVGVVREL